MIDQIEAIEGKSGSEKLFSSSIYYAIKSVEEA